METASFSGLLETILFIFAFYYVIKFLARLFLPIMAQKMMEKAADQFQQQHQNQQQQHNPQPKNSEKPKEKKVVGEYVDFEEIE